MKDFLLYCAGPILGCSYRECTSWREYVQGMLPDYITAISPMRGKEYLCGEKIIASQYKQHPLSTNKGITCRDRMDVMRCDAVLVNLLDAKTISIGTVMEIAWADMLRKPIIVAMETNNIHNHSILNEVSGFIVTDLDEAVRIAVAVLSPRL